MYYCCWPCVCDPDGGHADHQGRHPVRHVGFHQGRHSRTAVPLRGHRRPLPERGATDVPFISPSDGTHRRRCAATRARGAVRGRPFDRCHAYGPRLHCYIDVLRQPERRGGRRASGSPAASCSATATSSRTMSSTATCVPSARRTATIRAWARSSAVSLRSRPSAAVRRTPSTRRCE